MARARLLAVATAVAVAAATVWLPASPAFAHTKLTGSTPKAKATVTKPTTTVTLKFSGLIKKAGTTVVVVRRRTRPPTATARPRRSTARSPSRSGRCRSAPITVRWRTVSSDGHPIQGSFTFTNQAAPPATASPTPTAAATDRADEAFVTSAMPLVRTAEDGGSSPLGWIAAVAAAVVVFALGLAWWRRRRTIS